jgi:hypothetical protein
VLDARLLAKALALIMNNIFITLMLVFFSSTSLSAENVRFSDYESHLRIKEISFESPYIKFKGQIEVEGTLVFRLDMLTQTEFGEPMFADFIPRNDRLDLFPQVIEGRYPKKLVQLGVSNMHEIYGQFVGDDVEHKNNEVRIHGTALFESYTTTIECDSRKYFATLVKFLPSKDIASTDQKSIIGC